jgi:hypothetical protein
MMPKLTELAAFEPEKGGESIARYAMQGQVTDQIGDGFRHS